MFIKKVDLRLTLYINIKIPLFLPKLSGFCNNYQKNVLFETFSTPFLASLIYKSLKDLV